MKQKTKITLQAKQEQISKIKKIKRSVMDVVKLNWWTCLFVLPMATASLLTSSGTGSELVYRMAAISKMAYLLSNPIIYLLCFTKIRQYWNRKKNRLPKTPKRGISKDKRAALPSSSKTLKGDNMDSSSHQIRKQEIQEKSSSVEGELSSTIMRSQSLRNNTNLNEKGKNRFKRQSTGRKVCSSNSLRRSKIGEKHLNQRKVERNLTGTADGVRMSLRNDDLKVQALGKRTTCIGKKAKLGYTKSLDFNSRILKLDQSLPTLPRLSRSSTTC